jgi:hypothetical protein
VRPPDENQHGSTRPNFMSASRRQSSGEDNILARLERDGKRGAAAKSWKHMNATVAWCGLASLAVFGLVAVLATLAKENLAAHRKPLVVEARAASDRYADPDGKSGFAPLPAIGSLPRKPATIVEEQVERTIARAAEGTRAPPMVMLKPAAPAAIKPAPRTTSARQAPKSPSSKPAPPKIAAAVPARVLPVAPVRTKKVAAAPPAARPEPAPVDSDVALLSAIIMHASRHAAERAQMEACPTGKKCPVPKATD